MSDTTDTAATTAIDAPESPETLLLMPESTMSKRKTKTKTNATSSVDHDRANTSSKNGSAAGMGNKASSNGHRKRATAESMAAKQREISVSEFFAKNRHLLGFDNPRKAMLTTVKEAVDNSLDACEEAGIQPTIHVTMLQTDENRFKITVRDNGPGIVRKQIDNIFGKLLYGSKFHRLKMSRGQQGIGISAAGMYGLMTTGKPVLIISRTSKRKPSHRVMLKMDTSKNKADIVEDVEHPEYDDHFADGHGTEVTIELEGRYLKGKQSVDEYLEQTAIANPHAEIFYTSPNNERFHYERTVDELPPEPEEIKPHPNGIELGTMIQMLERTEATQLGAFFQRDFCRVGPGKAKEICTRAQKLLGADSNALTSKTYVSRVGHSEAEALYKAIQDVKITAPPTNCVVPIGTKVLLAGLLKEVKAEFYSASTRPPAVYRGRPFVIEAALAFGGDLPSDDSARVIRFANRVPLLYQQSGCSAFKAVVETNWRNYGLSQPRNSLPVAPLVVMIHMASVWVPFTSESKEAIADYDEIRREMRLALQECGRKMQTYLRRRARMRRQGERRNVFLRYIGEISKACAAITGHDAKSTYDALMEQAQTKTAEADQILDDEGNVLDNGGRLADDEGVVIRDDIAPVDQRNPEAFADDDENGLFGNGSNGNGNGRTKRKKRKKKVRRR